MTDLPISQAAIDLIVAEEVTSEATYRARYQAPEWPNGASGITIGIGYDCGYSTAGQIAADWSPRLPAAMVQALQGVAGLHGEAAHAALSRIRPIISVPWDAAMAVFHDRDMPKWIGIVRTHLSNCDLLGPDCLGALVSLAYNRGPSFHSEGDRYIEMRAIRDHMDEKRFDLIPGEFRSMKRLWQTKSVRGVALRREHEARLFERGLVIGKPATPPAPAPTPKPPTPAPAPRSWIDILIDIFFKRS